jgi:amino acid adenylation domain-containing protein/thioester reductase-like protein
MANKESVARRQDQLSSAKQALLQKWRTGQSGGYTIPRRPDHAPAPLSFAQQRLWFLEHLLPGTHVYNMTEAMRLSGTLDITALTQSLREILRRHETLRTAFVAVDGQPVQMIVPDLDVDLPVVDLRDLPADQRTAAAREHMTAQDQQPFDLTQVPLIRMQLLRLADNEHMLVVTMHHIIADGWSMGVLIRELTALYSAFAAGQPSPLPELPIQYADFAHWQQQLAQNSALDPHLEYWTGKLRDEPPILELPTDYPAPAMPSFRGQRRKMVLPRDVQTALHSLAQQEGGTLFTLLLAALTTLFYRYSGQTDIAIGTPIANRNRVELEGLVGFFVNTLVLRTDLSGRPTFRELLRRVTTTALEAYQHQDLPFEKLVEALQPERSLSHSPLFRVMFVLQNAPFPTLDMAGVTGTPETPPHDTAMFDLMVTAMETAEGLQFSLEYTRDLFAPETIDRMGQHLRMLLTGIAARPDAHLRALPLLTPAEQQQLLHDFNDTAVPYDHSTCLHHQIEAQVARTPDAPALNFADRQLSYRDLNARANQLAHLLQQQGVGPEAVVAICLDRSLDLVVGLLAILKAGGAYLPLDRAYPTDRLRMMLEDAHHPLLLTDTPATADLLQQQGASVCLDTVEPQLTTFPTTNPTSAITPDNLAYVIYTSGSTGRPKGVQNIHRAIVNRLRWMQAAYGLTPADRVLQKTPYSFDVSVWEFFWPLLTGASLVIARPGGHQDSAYLVRLIQQQQVTTLHFVPSMLQIFLQEPNAAACTSLTRVICSGEALPMDLQQRFFARLDAVALHNLYGPTEAAVDVTSWPCRRNDPRLSVPIGYPIHNIRIYILDPDYQPVPVGVPGELYIGGVGLARGYAHRPALTAEKFVPHPYSPSGGERLYRTGDLVRYLPDGAIEFLGRIDHQVKIRGFRIELGEIEAVLAAHPAVREAVVLAREDRPGDKRLVAYLVPVEVDGAAAPVLNPQELRAFLQERLPEYMVPAVFVPMDALPLTPNGKVNRKALPAPATDRRDLKQTYVPPRTPLEEALATMCGQLLGVERVGMNDSFFDLGGHSLLATRFIFRIRDTLQVELPLRLLFEQPTIAGMARAIEQMQAGTAQAALEIDLEPEAALDATIGIGQARPADPQHMARRVLLTGVTGFLGAFLLADLLRQTQAEVYCLVRAATVAEARRRIQANLEHYLVWDDHFSERIIPVPGDLAQPLLGLAPERFAELGQTIDSIYHNGALVNFIYPYAELKAPNVRGTHEVLRLASTHTVKPVHFVSTLYVFAPADADGRTAIGEDDIPAHGNTLPTGYTQSKWVAEHMLNQARARGLPIAIYRVGRVGGHSQTGACQTDDFFWRMVKAALEVGSVPDMNMLISIAPVDYVSQSIVALSQRTASWGQNFHLFNAHILPLRDFHQIINRLGYTATVLPTETWRQTLLERAQQDQTSAAYPLLPLLSRGNLEDWEEHVPFDDRRTRQALAGTGLTCPPLDVRLLETYLAYFRNQRFLPDPR